MVYNIFIYMFVYVMYIVFIGFVLWNEYWSAKVAEWFARSFGSVSVFICSFLYVCNSSRFGFSVGTPRSYDDRGLLPSRWELKVLFYYSFSNSVVFISNCNFLSKTVLLVLNISKFCMFSSHRSLTVWTLWVVIYVKCMYLLSNPSWFGRLRCNIIPWKKNSSSFG